MSVREMQGVPSPVVVLMSPEPLPEDIQALVRRPRYRKRIKFVLGSAMIQDDLSRYGAARFSRS